MGEEASIGLRFDTSALATDPVCQRFRSSIIELSAPALREDVRAVAERGWEDRTRSEYIGVMIVRHFHGLLVDLNAPADLQELALAMVIHEQQHTALCAEATRSLTPEATHPEVAFDVSELRLERTEAPLEEQLWQMILGTYLAGEVTAHALLRHAIRALPDTPYRDVLRRISRDEVLHAHIGPALLGSARRGDAPKWLPYPGDRWVWQFVMAQVQAMRKRDVVEPDEAELFGDPEAAAQLVQVGIPDSRDFKAAYLKALETAVPKALLKAGFPLQKTPAPNS